METTTEIKVKKANLKEDAIEIEYEQIIDDPEQGPTINLIKLKGGNKPHDDLKNAMHGLRFHLAMICEQVPKNAKSVYEHEIVLATVSTSISIGGSDENEGVTISGQRMLDSGMILNLNSPFTKWESDYKYSEDLFPDVAVVIQECKEYINGKCAPNPQLELLLENTGVETEKKRDGEAEAEAAA